MEPRWALRGAICPSLLCKIHGFSFSGTWPLCSGDSQVVHAEVSVVGFPSRNYLVGSRVHRSQFLRASGILAERPRVTGVRIPCPASLLGCYILESETRRETGDWASGDSLLSHPLTETPFPPVTIEKEYRCSLCHPHSGQATKTAGCIDQFLGELQGQTELPPEGNRVASARWM